MKTDEIINAGSRFLAYFSHDIRMPVSGIMGMADIALENMDDKEKLLECLNKIKVLQVIYCHLLIMYWTWYSMAAWNFIL